MRLQVILHQGKFDGHFMAISKVDGDWPTKIRIASGDSSADPVTAYNYRRHDVNEEGVIFMGSYVFTHSFESKRTLIEYWV